MTMRVYICVNTHWQITNLVPFVHLIETRGPFDLIVNLTATRTKGKSGKGNETNGNAAIRLADLQHAERVRSPLFDAIIYELRRRNLPMDLPVQRLEGPLKNPAYWREALLQVFDRLKASNSHKGIEVTYNYLGGPKEVMLGVMQALQTLKGDNRITYCLVSYDTPAAVLLIDDGNRETVESLEGADSLVSFEGYLRVHGFREMEMAREERKRREREALRRKDATLELASAVFGHDREKARRRLHALARLNVREPRSLSGLDAPFLALLLRIGREVFPNQARRLDRPEELIRLHGLQYLKSGWLEEYVWLAMREKMPPGACVFLGTKLSRQDSVDGFNDYEIDVAIYCRNQLHALECKISSSNQHMRRHMVNKAIVLKDELIGIGGRMIVLHARPLNNSDLADKARRAGVEIVHGPTRMQQFVEGFHPCGQ